MNTKMSTDPSVMTDDTMKKHDGDEAGNVEEKQSESVPVMTQTVVRTTTTTASSIQLYPQPQTHHRKLYILSLIQMYQNIYNQYITQLYKDMIWNLTKARRAMQSRSLSATTISSSSGTATATLLSVTHIPIHRIFHAQRRLFYTDDPNSTDSRSNGCKLYECDDHGRTTQVPPPILLNEDEEEDPVEDENPVEDEISHDLNVPNFGLRHRRGRPSTQPARTKLMKVDDDTNNDIETIESKTEPKTAEQNHMIQLLLLSNGVGIMSTTFSSSHQSFLIQSQTKSIQMLKYITTIQTQLIRELNQLISTKDIEK